jgi:hypothetical protein
MSVQNNTYICQIIIEKETLFFVNPFFSNLGKKSYFSYIKKNKTIQKREVQFNINLIIRKKK